LTSDSDIAGDTSQFVVTQLELRLLASDEDAKGQRVRTILDLDEVPVELAIDAYASLALRDLARYTEDDIVVAPPIAEAVELMSTSSTAMRIGVVGDAMAASAIYFDGTNGRLAVSPSDIPGCRILTKLVADEPLTRAVSRMVRAVAPADGDVAVALDLFEDAAMTTVGVRRRNGEYETDSDEAAGESGERFVAAVTDALTSPHDH
jgi:hypothetical protein